MDGRRPAAGHEDMVAGELSGVGDDAIGADAAGTNGRDAQAALGRDDGCRSHDGKACFARFGQEWAVGWVP